MAAKSPLPPSFDVSVLIYGHDGVRLEVDLVIPIQPRSVATNMHALDAYARMKFNDVLSDLKSSYPMACEFCSEPGRNNYVSAASYLHLPPRGTPWSGTVSPGPSLNAYIHSVCTMNGDCGNKARAAGSNVSKYPSINGDQNLEPDQYEDTEYPLNGSCLSCGRVQTIEEHLLRCSKCKTTKYCSTECQTGDWARHKKTCNWIKASRLVDSNDNVTVWKG